MSSSGGDIECGAMIVVHGNSGVVANTNGNKAKLDWDINDNHFPKLQQVSSAAVQIYIKLFIQNKDYFFVGDATNLDGSTATG
jgi:hypothetical protein